MSLLELRLLGGFAVLGPDGREVTIGPKKARALLARLGLAVGASVTREALSELIWGDVSAPEQARRSLRQALTVLRRSLPEGALSTCRERVTLSPAVAIDVARFEQFARAQERRLLEQVPSLYLGELLEGFSAQTECFDAWILKERCRLRDLAADALQRLCALQRQAGDTEPAMATAMLWVATDPVREIAHRELIELYDQAGRASEAVRQYHTLRALLRQQLGTAPDPKTTALVEAIQLGAERREVPSEAEHLKAPAPIALQPELRPMSVVALRIAEDAPLDPHLCRALDVELSRFGGSLVRTTERTALGAFGYPRAHDNDAERGVRAALAIIERLLKHGVGAACGVDCGQILVEVASERPVLQGQVVAHASELSAGPGPGVRVSEAVARALGERLITIHSQHADGSQAVVGVRKPIEMQPKTPLFGRQHELAPLLGTLALCTRHQRGRTFILRGEPGIGKTRLLSSLREAALAQGFIVHLHTVLDFGSGRDHPIIQLLRDLLQEDLERARGEATLDQEQSYDYSSLLTAVREISAVASETDPKRRLLEQQQLRAASCALLKRCAAHAPRLICVDDIHWLEPECLVHLASFISVAAHAPIVLVVTTRIEGEPEQACFRHAVRGGAVTTIDLAPLSEQDACAMVSALGFEGDEGADSTRDPRVQKLALRSGGNPLFIEQLAKGRHLRGVPMTIGSLVQARLDSLGEEDRLNLQAAAVLGPWFSRPALAYLRETEHNELSRPLQQALVFEQAEGYRFAHALVRDAIYAAIPAARRRALHTIAARYYAGRDLTAHAEHLERADDPGACGAYLRAANQERRAGHLSRAWKLCNRALALADLARERNAADLLAGELLTELGQPDKALAHFAEVERRTPPQALVHAHALLGQASVMRLQERIQEALHLLCRAERSIDPVRDASTLSRVHYLRGNVLFPLGDATACLRAHTLALSAARRARSILSEAQALSGVADAHFSAGRYRTSRGYYMQCEELAGKAGALHLELTVRSMVHIFDACDLAFARALEGFQQVAQQAATGSALRAEMLAFTDAAWMHVQLGAWEQGIHAATLALRIAERLGSPRFLALCFAYRSIAHFALEERKEAERCLERALAAINGQVSGFAHGAVYAALIVQSDPHQLSAVLDETDRWLRGSIVSLPAIVVLDRAIEATLWLGDSARARRYAQLLETSMQDEPHPLGMLLVSLGRVMAQHIDLASPAASPQVHQLRESLERTGLTPAARLVTRLVERAPGARPGGARTAAR